MLWHQLNRAQGCTSYPHRKIEIFFCEGTKYILGHGYRQRRWRLGEFSPKTPHCSLDKLLTFDPSPARLWRMVRVLCRSGPLHSHRPPLITSAITSACSTPAQYVPEPSPPAPAIHPRLALDITLAGSPSQQLFPQHAHRRRPSAHARPPTSTQLAHHHPNFSLNLPPSTQAQPLTSARLAQHLLQPSPQLKPECPPSAQHFSRP